MSQKTIQISFFAILTLSLLVLSFFVFKPYIGVIFLSAVFAISFHPVYIKFKSWFKGREGLSASLVLVVIVVAIIIPAIFISASLFSEAVSLYNSLIFGGGAERVVSFVDSIFARFGDNMNLLDFRMSDTSNYFRDVLGWIIGHFDSFFSTVFNGILGFILMLACVYYFLRNAEDIKKNVVMWSPLPDRYDEELISEIRSSVEVVFRGRLLIAIIQGVFIGLGFKVFGIGEPVLWGFVGGVASLIPTIGTALVTVPATLYLFANNQIGFGVGMLLWSAFIVGLIDNFLSVVLFNKKIHIHPLVILFSILGGVEIFGLIGFVVGPVAVSTLFSLIKIYPFIINSFKENR